MKMIFENYLKKYIIIKLDQDREDICLKLFLIGLYFKGELKFPLYVLKRESPDYEINIQNEYKGIEHTRATHEQYKHLNEIIKRRKKVKHLK